MKEVPPGRGRARPCWRAVASIDHARGLIRDGFLVTLPAGKASPDAVITGRPIMSQRFICALLRFSEKSQTAPTARRGVQCGRHRHPRKKHRPMFRGLFCLPTTSVLPIIQSGDFGTSPFFGQLHRQALLDRTPPHGMPAVKNNREQKINCVGRLRQSEQHQSGDVIRAWASGIMWFSRACGPTEPRSDRTAQGHDMTTICDVACSAGHQRRHPA